MIFWQDPVPQIAPSLIKIDHMKNDQLTEWNMVVAYTDPLVSSYP